MAKKRSDRNSVSTALEQARQAKEDYPAWPDSQPLSGDDVKDAEIIALFHQIQHHRPPNAWLPIDTIRAATLAQYLFLSGQDMSVLLRSGTMVRGERGPKPSPVLYALEKTGSSIALLMRQLGLTMQSNGMGDVRDQKALNTQFAKEHGGPPPVLSLLAGR